MNGAEVGRACSTCDEQGTYIEGLEAWRKDNSLKDLVEDGEYCKACFEEI